MAPLGVPGGRAARCSRSARRRRCHHCGELPARPRQLVLADYDPDEDERRRRGGLGSQRRVGWTSQALNAAAVDRRVRVVRVGRVPGQKHSDHEEQAAEAPRQLRPSEPDSCAGEPGLPAVRWGLTLPFRLARRPARLRARAARAPRRGGRLRRPVDGRDQRVRRLHAARAGCHVDRADAARHEVEVNPFTRAGSAGATRRRQHADASGLRFVGLGSSSGVIVERWNQRTFEKPLSRVRETVPVLRDPRRRARPGGFGFETPPAEPEVPIVIAALRDRMLRLGGELGDRRSSTSCHCRPPITSSSASGRAPRGRPNHLPLLLHPRRRARRRALHVRRLRHVAGL